MRINHVNKEREERNPKYQKLADPCRCERMQEDFSVVLEAKSDAFAGVSGNDFV